MDTRHIGHSQNFLHSPRLVADLVRESGIGKNDTVIEIGPGKGIITRELSRYASAVIAIEYDEDLYKKLKSKLSDYKNVQVIFGDFLKWSLPKKDDYVIFSNIPFNMTADILEKIFSALNPPKVSHLIIQEEAARKYAGKPYGEERFRSLAAKPWFEFSLRQSFRQTDFSPPPRVPIVMLEIRRRETPLISAKEKGSYLDFIAYAFSQHGKNLQERMRRVFTGEQFHRQASQQKFPSSSRPGDISFEKWLGLFQYFQKGVSEEKKKVIFGAHSDLTASQKRLRKIHRTRRERKRPSQVSS